MATRLWHYLENQFLRATEENFKKSIKLSTYHLARLKKKMDDNPLDTDYPIAYNRYKILDDALQPGYTKWKSSGETQTGETMTFGQLMQLRSTKLDKWDRNTQDHYDKTTPRYHAIWAHGHSPFYRGGDVAIIAAFATLSSNIGTDALLAAVKGEIDSYHTDLTGAHNTQQGAIGGTSAASNAFNLLRIAAMTGQYQNVGFFINKFPTSPDEIQYFFDVETLTNPEQTIWKGHLDANEVHAILTHTFALGDTMRLKSNGKGDCNYFLASTPGGIDSTPVSATSNHQVIIDVSAFGALDLSIHRYLTVVNTSGTFDTRFLVELY